ncbi:MAG: lactate utilization protein C [Burkholderiales bacterium]|nr:lactate utilization protein C [Burkholderiales bacterium]
MKGEENSAARKAILARIRTAQGRSGAPDDAEREAVRAHIRAHPQSPRPASDGELVTRFRERALGLASTWHEIGSDSEIPAATAVYLRENNLPLRAVCWQEFTGLDWAGSGMEVEARNARGDDLVGITGAFCAIAETGTLMTLSGPHTPAAVSLLPETHIAVVHKTRIVRGMEDAWELLRAEFEHLPRAVNFISGPSRTADIEQTVTLGAHGPYRVHIILTV